MSIDDELMIARKRVEYWRNEMGQGVARMEFYCREWSHAKDELKRLQDKQEAEQLDKTRTQTRQVPEWW